MTVDLQGLAAAGRALAVQLQGDTGTITRPATSSGTIDGSGVYTPPSSTVVYTGPCRVRRPTTAQEQQIVFGDINVTVARFVVNLPYDAPHIAIGDVFKVTVTNDPQIVNVPMRVAVVIAKSVLMYRQLGLEVIEQ